MRDRAVQRQVEADLPRQADPTFLHRQFPSRRCGIDPGQAKPGRLREIPGKTSKCRVIIILVRLRGIFPVIDHHQHQKAVEESGGIGGEGREGGKEPGALRQGGNRRQPAAVTAYPSWPRQARVWRYFVRMDRGMGGISPVPHRKFLAGSSSASSSGFPAPSSQWITVPFRSIRRNQVSWRLAKS